MFCSFEFLTSKPIFVLVVGVFRLKEVLIASAFSKIIFLFGGGGSFPGFGASQGPQVPNDLQRQLLWLVVLLYCVSSHLKYAHIFVTCLLHVPFAFQQSQSVAHLRAASGPPGALFKLLARQG